jgi:hypothetical protein
MDVDPSFIADGQAAVAGHPGEGSLDDPSVAAEFLAALDAAPDDPGCDAASAASVPATPMIVGLVGMQLAGFAAGTAALAADWWQGIEPGLERDAVVDIGAGQQEGERDATPVGDEVVPGLPRSVGFGPVAAPPFSLQWTCCPCRPGSSRSDLLAAAGAAIRGADGPIRPPSASHAAAASMSRPSRSPSPAEASPRGCPCAARTGCPSAPHAPGPLWRPPFGLGRSGGSRGASINQSSSETRGEVIPPHESITPGVQGGLKDILSKLAQ